MDGIAIGSQKKNIKNLISQLIKKINASASKKGKIVIKPNLVSLDPAQFTKSEIISALIDKLPLTEFLIIESNSFRQKFSNFEERLVKDAIVLNIMGWATVLNHTRVSYLNIDRMVFEGKSDEIVVSYSDKKTQIEIPNTLLEWKGANFISFTKLKESSGSIKNLFGMVPEGIHLERRKLHSNPVLMEEKIIAYFIYLHRNFNLIGLIEGLEEFPKNNPAGKYTSVFGSKYDIVRGRGIFLIGKPCSIDLDKCKILSENPNNLINKTKEAYNQNFSN